MTPDIWAGAAATARAVAAGQVSAVAVTEASLSAIARHNPRLNAFTAVTAQRARDRAAAVDAARAAGSRVGPLAGVPFAVKNLFDVAGLATLAGSRINRDRPPAHADATLIARLEAAGAVLVGALNMGEYAYDFTGENIHDGPSRNPHDTARMTGGSSGGSGGAVAGGLVPLALGSDTNGSIRVPASLCGLFGLKPTYGRLSRAGTFPFVASLDHLGPLARGTEDLTLAYDAMSGFDAADPVCQDRPAEPAFPVLERGAEGLRVAVLGGHFQRGATPEALAALMACARALNADRTLDLPEAARARAAAYVITASEGAALHLDRLRSRAADFRSGGARPAAGRRADPGGAGGAGAEVPPLVSDAGAAAVRQRGRAAGARHALHRAAYRPADVHAGRRGTPGAAQFGHLHPADLVHRPAGGSRAGPRRAADWRAGHRGPMAGGHRVARRGGPGTAGHRTGAAPGAGGLSGMDIDIPEVKAEVEAAFAAYERVLMANDVDGLGALFHDDPRTIRYGGGENLYGYAAIAAFRAGRSPVGLERTIEGTVITTYGRDFAVASTLFRRVTQPGKIGRQMQTWVRFADGWRVVAAHVSVIADPG